ncbi:type II toxin-antitoxin system mRNA interferase toxin, RelE/StbE family [Levilactobacillus yonginensis]
MIKRIEYTKIFLRNWKRLKKKHYDSSRMKQAIALIAAEDHDALVRQFKWHMLKGDKTGINEIHLDANWLLLYEVTSEDEITLLILNTGSHDML